MAPIPKPTISQTVEAIYRAYEADADTGFRDHLGASVAHRECQRAIWYGFRWFTVAQFDGRMLRLFETGNLAEARFVQNLRRVGVTVQDVDPETGRQFKLRDETGHFGGSMDGRALGVPEAPKTWHVTEFKTHSDKSFRDLVKKGVRDSKPAHWFQMQVYMGLSGLDRALYLAANKNTDELYSERIHFDAEEFTRIKARALRVIEAAEPPERISKDPAWFVCRTCYDREACHGGVVPARHCRSCLSATPVTSGEDAGKWHCERYGWTLNSRMQRHGCGSGHRYIPSIVPGKQIDAKIGGHGGKEVLWIEYEMNEGGIIWRDEGATE